MAHQEISKESVLYKTLTSVEKLSDGSCIKKITEIKDGRTSVREERVDCDKALEAVRESENSNEDMFRKGNADFDEQMKEKLREINKSFPGDNQQHVNTKQETYSDGKNKVVKVTRESSSIEETKKSETIPDGTKRTLKITRESFIEETKKTVAPEEPEDIPEGVKLLDESFSEEPMKNIEKDNEELAQNKLKENEELFSKEANEDNKGDEDSSDYNGDEREREEQLELANEDESFFKTILKSIFKTLLSPLYKLNIL